MTPPAASRPGASRSSRSSLSPHRGRRSPIRRSSVGLSPLRVVLPVAVTALLAALYLNYSTPSDDAEGPLSPLTGPGTRPTIGHVLSNDPPDWGRGKHFAPDVTAPGR